MAGDDPVAQGARGAVPEPHEEVGDGGGLDVYGLQHGAELVDGAGRLGALLYLGGKDGLSEDVADVGGLVDLERPGACVAVVLADGDERGWEDA